MTTELQPLDVNEQTVLTEMEAVIARGIDTFFDVGAALYTIRDRRLYRASASTFESYCKERWNFSGSRARQLIGAAQTVTTVTAEGLPAPSTERQARELGRVPEPERAEVWGKVVASPEPPSAEAIRRTAAERHPAPEPAQPRQQRRPPLWRDLARASLNFRGALNRLTAVTRDDRLSRTIRDGTVQSLVPELIASTTDTVSVLKTVAPFWEAPARNDRGRSWRDDQAAQLRESADFLRSLADKLESCL